MKNFIKVIIFLIIVIITGYVIDISYVSEKEAIKDCHSQATLVAYNGRDYDESYKIVYEDCMRRFGYQPE